MHNGVIPTAFPHSLNNGSMSDPSSVIHSPNKNGEPGVEANEPSGPTDSTFDTHYPTQAPYLQIALAEWQTTASWTTRRALQEDLRGTDAFARASAAYAPHSDTHFEQTPFPAAHKFVYPTVGQPVFPHPLGQMANMEADNSLFGVRRGVGRQSTSGTGYLKQSPSGPSSGFLDCNTPTVRSGPNYTPSSSDHNDQISPGLWPNPPDYASSCGSNKSAPDDWEITPGSSTVDVSQNVVYEANTATVSSLSLPVQINWRKIPQEHYIPKTGDKSFLRQQGVTFSVNGVTGFNMKRALDRAFTGLDGRDDPVLENANGPVSCRLLFPGYPTDTRCNQIAVTNWKKKRAPIVKSKLAYEIAKRVNKHLKALAMVPIDASVDPQWTVGQGWMKLEKMYLVSVSWVSRGSLQPEIWVEADDS